MSKRFYPRQRQSRIDAIGVGHSYNTPRNAQSRNDGVNHFLHGQDTVFTAVALTGTLADGANESAIVTGGETLIFTISGGGRFSKTVLTTNFAAFIAGLAGSAQIKAALLVGQFALSVNDTVLTLTLPAIGAYTIAADETLTWTIPSTAFEDRDIATTALAVGVITNGA